jgi:hypothetical protein
MHICNPVMWFIFNLQKRKETVMYTRKITMANLLSKKVPTWAVWIKTDVDTNV